MDEQVTLLALFREITPVADVLDELRRHQIDERDITVISGAPYPLQVLGRPMVWERLPLIAISGAIVGFLVGIFLNVGTPLLYSIHVGGQPLVPIPPSAIITYEFTMMGLLVSTFLGVLWESVFPSYGPKQYHPKISDGRIAILFRCTPQEQGAMEKMLHQHGVEEVVNPQETKL